MVSTLPSGGLGLNSGVKYSQCPSRTWNINKETQRVEGDTDQLPSVEQAANVILNTERFRWQIYQPFSGVRLDDLMGQDQGFVAAELQRRIREALMVDDRIHGISDFSVQFKGDVLSASFRVKSVYGLTNPMEVTLA